MEEYEYLENLNSEELAKIIDQMLDFEETTKALMILEEKDSQKALELGKDIIKNNKGMIIYKQQFGMFSFLTIKRT
jgi:hypothetical protein